MSNTFFGVAVDCADAATLARFWADVLDREVADQPTEQHAVVVVVGVEPIGEAADERFRSTSVSRTRSRATTVGPISLRALDPAADDHQGGRGCGTCGRHPSLLLAERGDGNRRRAPRES